jgi:hypothetical protein
MTPSQLAFLIAAVVLAALFLLRFLPEKRSTSGSEDDAKRFARLLVAEIKLYETYKVERGMKTNDLLGSLVDEISAAREKFSYRFNSPEIFDEALVSILADGDPAKLGPNFKRIAPRTLQ